MKLKAHWKSINPFRPNPVELEYTKTVEVPDNTDLDVLKTFAEKDSLQGYYFDKFEILN